MDPFSLALLNSVMRLLITVALMPFVSAIDSLTAGSVTASYLKANYLYGTNLYVGNGFYGYQSANWKNGFDVVTAVDFTNKQTTTKSIADYLGHS